MKRNDNERSKVEIININEIYEIIMIIWKYNNNENIYNENKWNEMKWKQYNIVMKILM